MKGSPPCCTSINSEGSASWGEVGGIIRALAASLEPPQLIDGLTTGFLPSPGGDVEVARVYTYVEPATATWTEHWVVQPPDFFSDPTRRTRLEYPRPQPQPRPWHSLEPQFSGYWHAAVVYQYVAPPSTVPQLPVGTFAFDVRCSGATPTWQGRLLRTVVGSVVQDRWVLFPGYLRPNGGSATELVPVDGDPRDLLREALQTGGPTSEYVDVTYTVALLP